MRDDFESTSIRELVQVLRRRLPNAYPGGSNGTDLKRFKAYVRRKSFQFNGCLYARTTNARMAENRLLRLCDELGCAFNVRRRSNLRADDGFVYVLI